MVQSVHSLDFRNVSKMCIIDIYKIKGCGMQEEDNLLVKHRRGNS